MVVIVYGMPYIPIPKVIICQSTLAYSTRGYTGFTLETQIALCYKKSYEFDQDYPPNVMN